MLGFSYWSAVFWGVLVLCHKVNGYFDLTVNPTDISPTLTRSLTINCTFTYDNNSNISSLIALIISKADQQDDDHFVELLTLNAFAPDQVNELAQTDASFSGHIGASEMSFLSLNWLYPSDKESGIYRCDANVMDKVGHPLELHSSTAHVTTTEPDLNQVVSALGSVLKTQDGLQLQIQNQTQTITDIQTDLEVQAQVTANLQAKLDLLEQQREELMAIMFKKSSEYSGRYYLLSTQPCPSADIAEMMCEHWSGYLAEIDDSAENVFIKNFLTNFTYQNTVFVGGTDEANEGTWVFRFSGRPVIFTSWYGGQPSSSYSTYDCMFLSRSYSWQMLASGCYSNSPDSYYLCEVPLS